MPPTDGKNVVLVVVDRLTKYSHFIAITHTYTAADVADVFIREVFHLHGMPRSITSDRDPIFISKFWESFFKLQGTRLCRSTAYHPQSDGQTEVVNRCLEHYLWCFVADKPAKWASLLPWAEWWYNSTHHSTINMSPHQALYGRPPPSIQSYLPGSTNVHAVDVALQDRDALLQLLRSNMTMAQNRMKQHADAHRTERHFEVGDWVFLKLHPYRQKSLVRRPSHKLAPRYYGPFQVAAKIGTVAYRLHLPADCKLHPVFHVSLLKRRIGTTLRAQVTLPPTDPSGSIHLSPLRVLDMAVQRKRHRSVTLWLVQWDGLPESDATWEEAHAIMNQFPQFRA